jgi:hypothetical protein
VRTRMTSSSVSVVVGVTVGTVALFEFLGGIMALHYDVEDNIVFKYTAKV